MLESLTALTLPQDHHGATLVGRAWVAGNPAGPVVVALRGNELVDLSSLAPTMSELATRSALCRAQIVSRSELMRST